MIRTIDISGKGDSDVKIESSGEYRLSAKYNKFKGRFSVKVNKK